MENGNGRNTKQANKFLKFYGCSRFCEAARWLNKLRKMSQLIGICSFNFIGDVSVTLVIIIITKCCSSYILLWIELSEGPEKGLNWFGLSVQGVECRFWNNSARIT